MRGVRATSSVAGVTTRGPKTLEEAAAYLSQLASLRSASSVAERVRERVHEVRDLADVLEEMWQSNKRKRGT